MKSYRKRILLANIITALVESAINAVFAILIVRYLLDGPWWAVYLAYLIMCVQDKVRS